MKKITYIFYVAIILSVVSCSNENTDKAEPASTTPETTEPVTTTPPATPPAESKKDHVEVAKDTPRTEISVGKDGGSIKTKKGTGVSVDEKGVKVGSKDVKIDIKTDTGN